MGIFQQSKSQMAQINTNNSMVEEHVSSKAPSTQKLKFVMAFCFPQIGVHVK